MGNTKNKRGPIINAFLTFIGVLLPEKEEYNNTEIQDLDSFNENDLNQQNVTKETVNVLRESLKNLGNSNETKGNMNKYRVTSKDKTRNTSALNKERQEEEYQK